MIQKLTQKSAPNKSEQKASDKQEQKEEKSSSDKESQSSPSNERINATPSARRAAREKGISLSEVSGKANDVVRKEDVERAHNKNQQVLLNLKKKKLLHHKHLKHHQNQ